MGGRSGPAGSAYRAARNPGTAEETSGTFLKGRESSVVERETKGQEFEFYFTDLFIRNLLNFSEESGGCEQIRIMKKVALCGIVRRLLHKTDTFCNMYVREDSLIDNLALGTRQRIFDGIPLLLKCG